MSSFYNRLYNRLNEAKSGLQLFVLSAFVLMLLLALLLPEAAKRIDQIVLEEIPRMIQQ